MCVRPQCRTKISLRKLYHVFSYVKLNFRVSFFFTLLAQNTPSFAKLRILSGCPEKPSKTSIFLENYGNLIFCKGRSVLSKKCKKETGSKI